MESPCIKKCELDDDDTCTGCGRSRTEIKNWVNFSQETREVIMERLNGNRSRT